MKKKAMKHVSAIITLAIVTFIASLTIAGMLLFGVEKVCMAVV